MRTLVLAVAAAALVAGSARPAAALLQFFKVFDEVYLADHPDEDFVKTARGAKMRCLICHQGKKRTNHNPYGIHLVPLLDKKEDIKDVEKVKKVLAEVGAMHSDPDDESSPTYDELFRQGQFPGGTLEEASQEPPEEP
ncbi:MAG TPA: hypothetical protein PJ982_01880 [Lacipirellulaceae bacterium]|nr:hypothetical protein [Lacipirellulaceae bacterium]